jgi:hypothetical protein
MLRIAHLSYFPVTLKSPNQHAVSIKLSNGFTRNGHAVFNLSDRDIARASGFGHRRLGRRAANRMVREFCRVHQPDLMILGHADMIDAETIADIRTALPALRVLQWNVDPLFEPDNVARINRKLDVVDATLISTAGPSLEQFRRPGQTVGFLPNPVDISIERGRMDQQPHPEFDLFYACGNPARPKRVVCGQEWNMEDFITALRARLPDLSMTTPGMFGQPFLNGAAYQSGLLRAGIGLNISRRADDFLYSSDRLAHVMGNGLLAIIERSTGYDQLFSDDEMVFFSSFDELAEKLDRFARNPGLRQQTAAAGRARYIELFNEQRIAAYVVEAAFGRANPADYPWPSLIG